MPGMPVTVAPLSPLAALAVYICIAVVWGIGVDLLVRTPGRRSEDRGEDRAERPVAEGVDPINLRRRRPLAQRLSGAVLIAAAIVLLMALRPVLTGG